MAFSTDITEGRIERCFIAAIIVYIVIFPFYRSWSTHSNWWDAMAARKVSRILKFAIFFETVRNVWLLYDVIELGAPVQQYNKDINFYWTFGESRDMINILTIFISVVTLL